MKDIKLNKVKIQTLRLLMSYVNVAITSDSKSGGGKINS